MILNESRQRRKAIGGEVKRTTRTRIIVETREVLLVRGEWLEGRCPQCGEQVAMVRLQDRADCCNVDENPGQAEAGPPHLIESGDGLRFICLKSLLKWF